MKTIFVVTHGEKEPGANPSMTEKGKKDLAILSSYLPKDIPEVWLGEAQRHEDVATALGLENHPNKWWSAVWGSAGSLETRENKRMLVLPSGRAVPFERTTSAYDGGPSVKAKVLTLPDNTVVCAGRECIIALGIPMREARSSALYAITIKDGGEMEINLIMEGKSNG